MFGVGHLEKVLTGSGDERIFKFGHDQLSVFGIVDDQEATSLKPLARALQAQGKAVVVTVSSVEKAERLTAEGVKAWPLQLSARLDALPLVCRAVGRTPPMHSCVVCEGLRVNWPEFVRRIGDSGCAGTAWP